MPTPLPSQTSVEEKLEEILVHMRRIDARDRKRFWGGMVRSIINLIPIVLLVWSTWYFVEHGPELMKKIADTAASSAAAYTKNQGQDVVNQIMKQYNTPAATR